MNHNEPPYKHDNRALLATIIGILIWSGLLVFGQVMGWI